MLIPSNTAFVRYSVGVLVPVVALVLRLPLMPLVGGAAPFLFFFPAVLVASWIGGMGPGLLATLVSALLASVAFIDPVLQFGIESPQDLVAFVLFLLTGTAMAWMGGQLRSAYGSLGEALERERAARNQAEEASRMKDEFLAALSHELRTPLNAMLGWTRLLRSSSLDVATTARALETIERSVNAQTQLVEDLLDTSRIVTGKLRLSPRPLELAPLIEAALESVRPAAEAKAIRIESVLDSNAGPVLGDPDRLQQVLWNLFANALKFTPKGGKVQVHLERINSHVEVTVSDTGEGIDPEFLPFVFDRFRQEDGSTTRRHGGLGIGLAIVRHMVELHGGTVRAESPGRGRGATFRVELPLTTAPRHEPTTAHRVHTSARGAVPFERAPRLDGVQVLAVDDEPDTRALLLATLSERGAEVQTAGSTAEALGTLDRWRPDILVSDIGMPGEDGYVLIEHVRRHESASTRTLPAIALTAYARSEDRVRALTAGFQAHLPKPVEPAELVALIASLVRRQEGT